MIKNSHLSSELKHKNRFVNFRNMMTLLTYLEAFSHWVPPAFSEVDVKRCSQSVVVEVKVSVNENFRTLLDFVFFGFLA